LKKPVFKVSFVKPQIRQQQGQQQQQQQQQQQPEQQALNGQEDQRCKVVDIRWLIINQPTRKWIRKDQGRSSTEGSTGGQIAAELPAEPPAERPPEPLLHQASIQKIAKKAGLRQQIKVAGPSA
jgi:hypothetical protein